MMPLTSNIMLAVFGVIFLTIAVVANENSSIYMTLAIIFTIMAFILHGFGL